jgi:E3 ubiquitin-protein ligase EDD1
LFHLRLESTSGSTSAQETFVSTINVQINPNSSSTVPAGTTKTDQQPQQQLVNDNTPLFWQPNKKMPGFYAPRPGKNTPIRLNTFRNVGRVMAICLLQNELCPIVLSRHVIKYILNRPIKWHDLAFFDSDMYESFRKMVHDTESYLVESIGKAKHSAKLSSTQAIRNAMIKAMNEVDEKIFRPLELTFNIDLPPEEGGINSDLVTNGSNIEVFKKFI